MTEKLRFKLKPWEDGFALVSCGWCQSEEIEEVKKDIEHLMWRFKLKAHTIGCCGECYNKRMEEFNKENEKTIT